MLETIASLDDDALIADMYPDGSPAPDWGDVAFRAMQHRSLSEQGYRIAYALIETPVRAGPRNLAALLRVRDPSVRLLAFEELATNWWRSSDDTEVSRALARAVGREKDPGVRSGMEAILDAMIQNKTSSGSGNTDGPE
ncbi:MAG: hypothetical protein ACYTFI_22025 [Planctomycetota bacterium]